jgi:hypothetical protein
MSRIPKRHGHFLFGFIQSGLDLRGSGRNFERSTFQQLNVRKPMG